MSKHGHNKSKFYLRTDEVLAERYRVIARLGSGWEGEVFKIEEIDTGIERAAKLFFPHRNIRNAAARRYALKLHKLKHCSGVIQYVNQEKILLADQLVTVLISEYVEGEILGRYLRGKRLAVFEALHLLHSIAAGIAEIHLANEYHGDLHADNIIVRRFGLGYDIKLLDFFHWHAPKKENIQDDVCNLIRLLYDMLGGAARYRNQPPEVKQICCGLKRSLILSKFRTAAHLRDHLEAMEWAA